jgi:hypothetical protein
VEQYLLWVIGIIALLILFPLVAVEVHHRMQQRNHKARGTRRTDKIQL